MSSGGETRKNRLNYIKGKSKEGSSDTTTTATILIKLINWGTMLYRKFIQLFIYSFQYLCLPRYRDAAGVELAIKILITLTKRHAFDRRKLFNIEYIFGVDGFLLLTRIT